MSYARLLLCSDLLVQMTMAADRLSVVGQRRFTCVGCKGGGVRSNSAADADILNN